MIENQLDAAATLLKEAQVVCKSATERAKKLATKLAPKTTLPEVAK